MAGNYTISVGTVGGGLSVSPNGGETWEPASATPCPPSATSARWPRTPAIGAGSTPAPTAGCSDPTTTASLGATSNPPWTTCRSGPWGVDPRRLRHGVRRHPAQRFSVRGTAGRAGSRWTWASGCPALSASPAPPTSSSTSRDTRTVWAGIEVDGRVSQLGRRRQLDAPARPGSRPVPRGHSRHGAEARPPTRRSTAPRPSASPPATTRERAGICTSSPRFHAEDVRSYCRRHGHQAR